MVDLEQQSHMICRKGRRGTNAEIYITAVPEVSICLVVSHIWVDAELSAVFSFEWKKAVKNPFATSFCSGEILLRVISVQAGYWQEFKENACDRWTEQDLEVFISSE